MSEVPLASIVVVSYNNWPDIELAIQSALCQSYRAVEVIVVDNGSTDSSAAEIARLFGDRVRFVRQENLMDAGAYNTGFRLARGNFLQFLDGDDVLSPDKIEKQMAIMTSDEATDIVFGDIRHFQGATGEPSWIDYSSRNYDDMLAAALDQEPLGVRTILSVLMRRRVLERVGEWDREVYCTDLDYWLRAAWLGCRFTWCPGILGFSRVHARQMSADPVAMNRGHEAVLRKALTYVDKEPYVSMIRTNLAQMRYVRALARREFSRSEAIAKLREARATSPDVVPLGAYLLGLTAIVAPGGSRLATSPTVRTVRRFIARAVGFRVPRL